MGNGMNKQLEMQKWRTEGMAYALDIVRKEGVEGLEKIVKQRFKTGFTCKYVPHDEWKAHHDEMAAWYYVSILSTMLMLLHDDHGFDKEMDTELSERFLDVVDSTVRPELGVSIQDFIKEAERITEMEIGIPARWRKA